MEPKLIRNRALEFCDFTKYILVIWWLKKFIHFAVITTAYGQFHNQYMRLQRYFNPILRHRRSGYLALVRIFQNRFSFSQSFSFWGKSEAKLGSSSQVRARLVVFGMLRTKINDALRKLIRKETGRLQCSSGFKPTLPSS